MATGGPTHLGALPPTDESVERLINAALIWVASQNLGMLRVAQYSTTGSPVSVGGGTPTTATVTVTTAGTPVQVSASSVPVNGVWVNADLIAGIVVTVGDANVEGALTGMRGVVLTPGNPPIFLQVSNLNLLWVDAQNNGGKLALLYFV